MQLKSVFPAPLDQYLADFNMPFFEKRATCENCLMARSAGGFAYKEQLKCCTFFPFLYNYQVGALLKEAPPEIIAKLRNYIEGTQAQPLGLAPSFDYQQKFLKRGIEAFGRDEELLCPYFDRKASRCGIWRWRGGVCTSFYCESSFGLEGIEFWREIEKLLLKLESHLAHDALLAQGFTQFEAQACLKALPQKSLHAFRFSSELWLEFDQNRSRFYERCFEHVLQLSPAQADFFGDHETQIMRDKLRAKAYDFASRVADL
jgi:hypothetical protein